MYHKEEVEVVEVPVYKEVIKKIRKKQIVEVRNEVPKYVYDYVDKYVDVPEIQYVDKVVEVPQVQNVIKQVPRREIIEVPREVVRHVPKIDKRVVEKIVEVPGEVIQVPKPYLVENKIVVPRLIKQEIPVVVAQTLIPSITESENETVEVVLNEYVPKLVPFEVFVPKPVNRQAVSKSCVDEYKIVDVPGPQWNTLVKNVNPDFDPTDLRDYMSHVNGTVPYATGPGTYIVAPQTEAWKEGREEGEDDYAKLRFYDVPVNLHIQDHQHLLRQQHPGNVEPNQYVDTTQYIDHGYTTFNNQYVSRGYNGSPMSHHPGHYQSPVQAYRHYATTSPQYASSPEDHSQLHQSHYVHQQYNQYVRQPTQHY